MRRVTWMALLLAVVAGALVMRSRTDRTPPPPVTPAPAPAANAPEVPKPPVEQRVTLYLAREIPGQMAGEFGLAPVERTLAGPGAPAEAYLKALAQGPTKEEESKGFAPTLPQGTRVLGAGREGGVVTANFSHELRDNFNGGAEWEEVVLYSIVNSLTELEGVESVRIRIEGAPVESIGGHLAADEPLRRNSEIVARGKQGE